SLLWQVQLIERIPGVGRDRDGDRLRLRPIEVAQAADHPLRVLLELCDLHVAAGDERRAGGGDWLAHLCDAGEELACARRDGAARNAGLDGLRKIEEAQ